jgi:hypothetical protein
MIASMSPQIRSPWRRPGLRAVGLAALVGVYSAVPGCVSVDGRPQEESGSYMEIEHQIMNDEALPQPLLLVRALDLEGRALPGALVEVADAGGPSAKRYRTGTPEGLVEPEVRPGQWRITVSVAGFEPVSGRAVVKRDRSCVVRAFLRLFPGNGSMLASRRGERRGPG